MMRHQNRTRPLRSRGFVLLYAVMTSTIVLAVGVSIISIALKQLAISTLGRESQYAFYAANTGAECALYWDFHGVLKPVVTSIDGAAYERLAVFSNPLLSTGREVTEDADMATVTCAQTKLMANIDPSGNVGPDGINDTWYEVSPCAGYSAGECDETRFTVFLGRDDSGNEDREGPCARVTLQKVRGGGSPFVANPLGSNLQTIVDSRGYNYCSEDYFRRVERGLRFTY